MTGSSRGPGIAPGRGQLGLVCYESRLRCLKECRSELIRCSGRLTALVARKKPPLPGPRWGQKSGGEKHMQPPSAPTPPLKSVLGIVGTSSALEGMRDKSQPRGAVKSQGAAAVGG